MRMFTGTEMLGMFGGLSRSLTELDEVMSGLRVSNAAADCCEWLIEQEADPRAVEALASLADAAYEIEANRWKRDKLLAGGVRTEQ